MSLGCEYCEIDASEWKSVIGCLTQLGAKQLVSMGLEEIPVIEPIIVKMMLLGNLPSGISEIMECFHTGKPVYSQVLFSLQLVCCLIQCRY